MYLFSFGRKKFTTANHNIQNSDFKIQSFFDDYQLRLCLKQINT